MLERCVFVKHKITLRKNRYGKYYRVYVLKTSFDEELIWVTTSEKTVLEEGERYRISFDGKYDEDGNLNKHIHKVSILPREDVMKYSIDNAKWTDSGWENNVFQLSFGDFADEDGDKFFFLIEYRKKDDRYVFFMEYEYDEIIYDGENKSFNDFFERHMSKEMMKTTITLMEQLMR